MTQTIVKKNCGLSIRANNRGSKKMKMIKTQQLTFSANNRGYRKMKIIETFQLTSNANHLSLIAVLDEEPGS